ncbi:MAG: lactonase family protein [Chloroflexia bacterium]
MFRINIRGSIKAFLALALLVSTFAIGSGSTALAAERNREGSGAVYALTNAAAGNSVVAFDRASNGSLSFADTYSTGGLGSGDGLGSQGALILSENNNWLFAVNAGSNDISVFSVGRHGLELVDRVASGGTRPIGLTENNGVLYVLNAGGSGNITGFNVGHDGHLSPIAGSTQPLSGNATGPAQVQFSTDGRLLAVTEKATSKIDIYTVSKGGVASGPTVHNSSGATPFGFAFGKGGKLVVSEASGAVSSYAVGNDGSFNVVSGSSPTHQTAACWLVLTGNQRYAYAANAGSASISGYTVDGDGNLALLNADGRTGLTGAHPADLAMSINSHYLYSLNITPTSQGISAFEVQSDGSLVNVPLSGITGLTTASAGLAAR